MKKMILAVLLSFSAYAEEPYSYAISEQAYSFSTYFEMQRKDGYDGTIIKKKYINLRTHYHLYDADGNYEATGICRFFSLGLFFVWGKEIDVYDSDGNWIGMIDGQMMTEASAKFSIYDASSNLMGIAYLDKGSSSFAVFDPDNDKKIVAKLRRNFILDTVDNWDVAYYEPSRFDLRVMKIFSAFALDYQEYFKEDR
jgi:hypothetical protein